MNVWCGVGRLSKDPKSSTSGKYVDINLAVEDYAFGEVRCYFIPVRFVGEKTINRVLKFLRKGTRIAVTGKLCYERNKEGTAWYTTILANTFDFADAKTSAKPATGEDGFMEIPEGLSDDSMPFN